MSVIRSIPALLALLAVLATGEAGLPGQALADTPAPLPTQIRIRDVSQPPTPSTPAKPFVSRPAKHKSRRAKAPRRPAAPPTAQAPAREAGPAPVAQNPAQPKLEKRYEAATESIFPLDPEPAKAPNPATGKPAEPGPAPAAFPPEPAPAKAPAAK
jgi:hypothetical protein